MESKWFFFAIKKNNKLRSHIKEKFNFKRQNKLSHKSENGQVLVEGLLIFIVLISFFLGLQTVVEINQKQLKIKSKISGSI